MLMKMSSVQSGTVSLDETSIRYGRRKKRKCTVIRSVYARLMSMSGVGLEGGHSSVLGKLRSAKYCILYED